MTLSRQAGPQAPLLPPGSPRQQIKQPCRQISHRLGARGWCPPGSSRAPYPPLRGPSGLPRPPLCTPPSPPPGGLRDGGCLPRFWGRNCTPSQAGAREAWPREDVLQSQCRRAHAATPGSAPQAPGEGGPWQGQHRPRDGVREGPRGGPPAWDLGHRPWRSGGPGRGTCIPEAPPPAAWAGVSLLGLPLRTLRGCAVLLVCRPSVFHLLFLFKQILTVHSFLSPV